VSFLHENDQSCEKDREALWEEVKGRTPKSNQDVQVYGTGVLSSTHYLEAIRLQRNEITE
jgi:hypothetical protein